MDKPNNTQNEQSPTARQIAWSDIATVVVEESLRQCYFLSRSEERALQRQAGDDYRAGDEMVDSMNRFSGHGRDSAVAHLRAAEDASSNPGDTGARVLLELGVLGAMLRGYEQMGVERVRGILRRVLSERLGESAPLPRR